VKEKKSAIFRLVSAKNIYRIVTPDCYFSFVSIATSVSIIARREFVIRILRRKYSVMIYLNVLQFTEIKILIKDASFVPPSLFLFIFYNRAMENDDREERAKNTTDRRRSASVILPVARLRSFHKIVKR